jgi:predicted aspartyl protease
MTRFARAALPALLLPFLLGILPPSAQAAECGNLHLVASLKLEDSDSHRVIVPVSINGTARKFLFDTGGAISQISPAVVKELKLPTHSGDISLMDMNGYASNKVVTIDDFAFGPIKAKNIPFLVATLEGYDGILTPSRFQNVDVDIDFGPRRLNLFLDDHCPGKVLYWKAAALAAVPVTLKNNHYNLDVTLDGHVLHGIIDTGATATFLRAPVASRMFGLTQDTPGMEPSGYINGDKETPAFRHTFSSLGFDGIAVANPRVIIAPDRTGAHDINNDLKTGSFIQHVDDDMERPDIIIGMNVLSKLHIYFATKEKKLYVTAAGAPDAPSPFAPAQK